MAKQQRQRYCPSAFVLTYLALLVTAAAAAFGVSSTSMIRSTTPTPGLLAYRQYVAITSQKAPYSRQQASVPLFSATTNNDDAEPSECVRTRLRKLTGFSLTAFRASIRAVTGISMTAVYASMLAATGAWIRQSMKLILSMFPTWLRYFVQPFLVLYYAPLFILRNVSSRTTRRDALKTHEQVLDGWKHAVQVAETTTNEWPLHYNEETGEFESKVPDLDVNSVVADSVQVALKEEASGSS